MEFNTIQDNPIA